MSIPLLLLLGHYSLYDPPIHRPSGSWVPSFSATHLSAAPDVDFEAILSVNITITITFVDVLPSLVVSEPGHDKYHQ